MSVRRSARPVARRIPVAARRIHDDACLSVDDVRCADEPPALGPEEASAMIEVVFPVTGTFVRHLLRRGRGRAIVGDAATALVFRPAEPYRVAHPGGGADRSVAVALKPGVPDALGRSLRDLPDAARTSPAADLLLRRWLRRVRYGPGDLLEGSEVAALLVDHVLGAAAGPLRSVAADRLADAVRLALAADLGAHLTLPELGHRVGASPFHLSRCFRAATGSTIHAWRRSLRVREALARIDAGERDLTALALDLGFSHHSHLTNTIRAETGRPPSAFRREPTRTEIAALRTILQA